MKLQRHPANPILMPDLNSEWECTNVFNPSVTHHSGLFHMHYRAQGLDWISRIGYAVSEDGIHWNRLRQPVFVPENGSDARGVEDPRVTAIEGTFYMCYTARGIGQQGSADNSQTGGCIQPMIAKSDNLISWERVGAIVRGEDNKDHLLFPKKSAGSYVAFHRRAPNIWLAYTRDLLNWPEDEMLPLFGPRADNGWDSKSVGANGVPIETEHGWIMIYHGYDQSGVYRFGACLLDRQYPSQVLRRPSSFIFEPEEQWEIRGDRPNVVFSNANPAVDGTVYVYYGGGDHVIGLATCSLEALVDYVMTAE